MTSAFGTDPKSRTMADPMGGVGGQLETHPPRNSGNPPPPLWGTTHTKKNPAPSPLAAKLFHISVMFMVLSVEPTLQNFGVRGPTHAVWLCQPGGMP